MEIAVAPWYTLNAPRQTFRRPHSQSGRPMVGPPLRTWGPHGGPGLHPASRPGGLPTRRYWAQRSPNGPDTPEPTEACVRQAKAMRNYHPHHPFNHSPPALPWPTDPPETVQKLANLTRNRVKATTQTPAEPLLRDPGQQATQPFFQAPPPPVPAPPVLPKRTRRKRGTARP